MKTTTILLALAIVGGALIAAAPAASARSVCSNTADEGCRAFLCVKGFCTSDLNPVCVTEPCPQPIP